VGEQLYPYQEAAVAALEAGVSLLAAVPGAGKTACAIEFAKQTGARGSGMCPPPALRPPSIFAAAKPDHRHSRKPTGLYERVERIWPNGGQGRVVRSGTSHADPAGSAGAMK
jgi:hypothetical protein